MWDATGKDTVRSSSALIRSISYPGGQVVILDTAAFSAKSVMMRGIARGHLPLSLQPAHCFVIGMCDSLGGTAKEE